MPGLAVSGLFTIPNEYDWQESETGQGYWVAFKVYYPDKDYKGNNFFHKFKIVMWVNHEQKRQLKEIIKPGRFFMVSGHIDARLRDDMQYDPPPQLRTEFRNFVLTKISKVE